MVRGRPLDLTGQRFGRWTVREKSDLTESRKRLWLCLCDCGAKALVQAGNLRSGRSKGCRSCYEGSRKP